MDNVNEHVGDLLEEIMKKESEQLEQRIARYAKFM